MNREEAIKIIEEFNEAGGSIFIDGCKGSMPDSDLITLAKDCQQLLSMYQGEEE